MGGSLYGGGSFPGFGLDVETGEVGLVATFAAIALSLIACGHLRLVFGGVAGDILGILHISSMIAAFGTYRQ